MDHHTSVRRMKLEKSVSIHHMSVQDIGDCKEFLMPLSRWKECQTKLFEWKYLCRQFWPVIFLAIGSPIATRRHSVPRSAVRSNWLVGIPGTGKCGVTCGWCLEEECDRWCVTCGSVYKKGLDVRIVPSIVYRCNCRVASCSFAAAVKVWCRSADVNITLTTSLPLSWLSNPWNSSIVDGNENFYLVGFGNFICWEWNWYLVKLHFPFF